MPIGAGVIAFIAIIVVLSGLKILNEYERAVIFRLGRLTAYRGPGVVFIVPILERTVRIDLRTVTLEIPSQDVITKDNVTVKVSAVLYFRVIDPSLVGNGRAKETNIYIALTVGIGGFERMPFGGPYATPEQMALIVEWIDDGMPD